MTASAWPPCSAAAREARRARGQSIGRPKALTPDQARQIRALHTTGGGVPELMATFGVSRATIYRALSEAPIPTMTKEHLP